jgi:sensor c-di-GMP phosphodiesterase-like protein
MAQGYLISRPIPPDEFIAWLKDYRASANTVAQHG